MKICIIVAGLMVAVFSHPARADGVVTLIRAGHLIDTDSGRMLDSQMLLVRDGVIAEIGPAIRVPAGARVVDLSGYTVLPGLIDAHTHLTIDSKNQDPLAELEHTAAERAFGSLPNALAVLLAGFTTVRDLGSYRALVDVALRDAINRGDVVDRACTSPARTLRSPAVPVQLPVTRRTSRCPGISATAMPIRQARYASESELWRDSAWM